MSTPSPFPEPPFSTTTYPMQSVRASNDYEWANSMWGVYTGGTDESYNVSGSGDSGLQRRQTFSVLEQCMLSYQESERLQSVVISGPPYAIDTVSYICVGGPGAQYVDVAVYPAGRSSVAQYQGWNGTSFADGPAVVDANGNYWYRLELKWGRPYPSWSQVFYAKTYRFSGEGAAPSFKLWAFSHYRGESPHIAISHNAAYDFGTNPFTLIAEVSPTTIETNAAGTPTTVIATGNILSSFAPGQTSGIGSWRLAITASLAESIFNPRPTVYPYKPFLSFCLYGADGSRHEVVAPLSSQYIDKIRQTEETEITFSESAFKLYSHLVAVVRDSSGACHLYLDGRLLPPVNEPSATSSIDVNNNNPLTVGGMIPAPPAGRQGPVVRVASLWNQALSQSEIIDAAKWFSDLTISPAFDTSAGQPTPNNDTQTYWIRGTSTITFEDVEGNTQTATGNVDQDTNVRGGQEGSLQATISGMTNSLYSAAKSNAAEIAINQTAHPARYTYDAATQKITYRHVPWEDSRCIGFWKFDENGNDLSTTANSVEVDASLYQNPVIALPFYMEEQEKSMWCWAATSVSMIRFYNPLWTENQCTLLSRTLKARRLIAADATPCSSTSIADPEAYNIPADPRAAWNIPGISISSENEDLTVGVTAFMTISDNLDTIIGQLDANTLPASLRPGITTYINETYAAKVQALEGDPKPILQDVTLSQKKVSAKWQLVDNNLNEYFWIQIEGEGTNRRLKIYDENTLAIRTISDRLFQTFQSQLNRRCPVLAILWKRGDRVFSHYIVISGAYEENGRKKLVINDSWDGISIVDCQTFPANYLNDGQADSKIGLIAYTKPLKRS